MRPPLKLVLVSHGDGLSAGAERSLLELARGLSTDGRISPVVTVPGEGALSTALRAAGVPVVVMPTPMWTPYEPDAFEATTALGRVRRRAAVMARTLRYSRHWLRMLRTERPDVVVTNTATTVAPALAARGLGIPHVWMVREFVTLDHRMQYALGERLSQRLIGALSARVLVNSKAVGRHFSPRVPDDKLVVAYPPVEVPAVASGQHESGRLRVLMLGRQSRAKGSMLVIEALHVLRGCRRRDETPDVRLVGWAADDFRRELEARALELGVADDVRITAGTDRPFEAIEWADVLLMCSDNEAFGRVTAEALKCGRPVIGGRGGATPEIVAHGEDGLLFDSGDASSLAAALDRLDRDRQLLRELGERARARNSHRFTLDEHLDTFVTAVRSAVGDAAR